MSSKIYTNAGLAILSLLGSIFLMRMLYSKYRKRSPHYLSPTDRILLGITLVDIMSSSRQVSTLFWDPTEPNAICTAQGFVQSLSMMGPAYNMWLSVLYRIQVQDRHSGSAITAKRIKVREIVGHVTSISLCMLVAVLALSYEVYNPASYFPGCSFNVY